MKGVDKHCSRCGRTWQDCRCYTNAPEVAMYKFEIPFGCDARLLRREKGTPYEPGSRRFESIMTLPRRGDLTPSGLLGGWRGRVDNEAEDFRYVLGTWEFEEAMKKREWCSEHASKYIYPPEPIELSTFTLVDLKNPSKCGDLLTDFLEEIDKLAAGVEANAICFRHEYSFTISPTDMPGVGNFMAFSRFHLLR